MPDELLCCHCHAPIGMEDLPSPNATLFECPYCHTVNTLEDSRKYVDQAKAEVLAWISKAIPPGLDINNAQNADPLARANIFANNFRPVIESSSMEYRFGLLSAMSNQLIALPYRKIKTGVIKHNTKQLYDFDAKTHSVSPFAVDSDSQGLLKTSSMVAVTYATLLNNIDLLSRDDEHKYQFMKTNFLSAADTLKDDPSYDPLRKRFEILAVAVDGLDCIMMNKPAEAKSLLQKAKESLTALKQEVMSNIDFGSMSTALSKEISVCGSAYLIAEALDTNADVDVIGVLKTVKNLMDETEREENLIAGAYSTAMKRLDRYDDLFKMFSQVLKARSGEESLRIAPGTGSFYMPMWAVEVKYSFTGGSFLKKKAVVVSEMILASGMFTTVPHVISNPRTAITDVFGAMPEASLMSRLKGNQESISAGGPVRDMYEKVQNMNPGRTKILLPTTTKQEIEILCNAYLDQSKTSHPKLQMGKSVAKEMIFVPCDIVGDKIKLNISLPNMHPTDMCNTSVAKGLAL